VFVRGVRLVDVHIMARWKKAGWVVARQKLAELRSRSVELYSPLSDKQLAVEQIPGAFIFLPFALDPCPRFRLAVPAVAEA
jgi:hypothetical protein